MDKEAAFLEAQEKEFCKSHDKQESAEGWCFLWDVARLNGIPWVNTPECKSFLESLVEGCPSKDPEQENLKALGWKLYEYKKDYEKKHTEQRGRGVQLTASAQVQSPAEFEDCLQMMHPQGSKGPARAKAKAKKGEQEQDPKKNFLKWASKAQTDLQKQQAKAQGVLQKFEQATKEPWYTKKFLGQVQKGNDMLERVLKKLIKVVALSSSADPETFTAKKFQDIQQEVSDALKEALDPKRPILQASSMLASRA